MSDDQMKVDETKPPRTFGKKVVEFITAMVISLAVVLPIRYFLVQPFIVRGASMEPNFSDREYLIIDELSYRLRNPGRGEVVVFRFPKNPTMCESVVPRLFDFSGTCKYLIKRVIGLPGERVEMQNGSIHIYSASSTDTFLLNEHEYFGQDAPPTHPDGVFTLGAGEYFVLGDNRDFSSDSRFWGPLERRFIVGRTIFRVVPLSKFGMLD